MTHYAFDTPTQILQVLPFPHPEDRSLDLVLANQPHAPQPYITWVRNRSTVIPGYSHGHYFADYAHAQHDLAQRYAALVERAYPLESTPAPSAATVAPPSTSPAGSLSEDTRLQTILVAAMPYDLHQDPSSARFAICHHGTYEIAATMTEDFLNRLTETDATAELT